MADTRGRLIAGAIETLRRHGIAGTSARTIAATAGVNQALVFYHFGSVDELLNQACLVSTQDRVGTYHDRFAAVTSLRELLDLGGRLHAEERAQGNVAVLGQLLAAAQSDERFRPICKRSLDLWADEVEAVLRRVLAGSAVADLADPAGLARAVSAAFVGLELYEGVDPQGATAVFATLDRLAVLLDVVESLGPVARRALQARLRKAG
jgi:AcrR family transcriptional regulator